jgi:hypothetical protein
MAILKKPHLCKTCGEIDPCNFHIGKKYICKKCRLIKAAEYYAKPEIKARAAEYRSKPENKIKKANNDAKPENKVKRVQYNIKRRQIDSTYRFVDNLRRRQRDVVRGKISTTEGLGCNSEFLIKYIESLWEPWMTWDNYGIGEGQWSMDHIIPISIFDTDSEGDWDANSEYNKKLIHYTNLRPLLHKENIKKSNKIL